MNGDAPQTLIAEDCKLPAEAWTSCCKAAALVIHFSTEPHRPDQLEDLLKLISSLPKHLESITASSPLLPRKSSASLSHRLADALIASACSKTLKALDLGSCVEPGACTLFSKQAADALIAALPSLISLGISIKADKSDSWRPNLPAMLTSLHLGVTSEGFRSPIFSLDLASLAAATALLELSIDAWCPRITNVSALTNLSKLTSAQIHHDWEAEHQYSNAIPQFWKALSKLPKLDTLRLMSPVKLGPEEFTDVQYTALKHVELHDLDVAMPNESLSSCLVNALPNIKTMIVHDAVSQYRLARGLRYHTSLERLQHYCTSHCAPANGPWLQPQLCTVSSLTSLDWQLSYEPYEADKMMSGLAACPALVEMRLSDSPGFTLHQMTTLAAGACGGTLRILDLTYQGSSTCSLMAIAALFRGGLSRLEKLRLHDMDCANMLRMDQQKLRGVVAGEMSKYQLLQMLHAFAHSGELVRKVAAAAGASEAQLAAAEAAASEAVAAAKAAGSAAAAAEEQPPHKRQKTGSETDAEAAREPLTMVLRAPVAEDAERLTRLHELQAGEVLQLLQLVGRRLQRPQCEAERVSDVEGAALLGHVSCGLQLRVLLAGLMKGLFAGAGRGERVRLALVHSGCDVELSLLLGPVMMYR